MAEQPVVGAEQSAGPAQAFVQSMTVPPRNPWQVRPETQSVVIAQA
jgi:hypothetical protein